MERYRAAVIKLITTETDAGKAWKASSEAAKEAAHAMNEWQADHQSQLEQVAAETALIGQSTESRKIAVAMMQVEADAKSASPR